MRERATLKQIASELNVSISTVSKAINDSPEISRNTREKVKEYAKLKHYRPNVIGLHLKMRKTKTIGFVVPDILNPFFAKVFSGIETVAGKRGYSVIMSISNETLEKEQKVLAMLGNGTVDGFIFSVCQEAMAKGEYSHITDLIEESVPMVMIDRIVPGLNCDKVEVDDFESAVNSTQFLINTGCRNIALFSSIDDLTIGKLRAEGYLKALERNQIKVNPNIIIRTNSLDDLETRIEKAFDENKIDAIFALDEEDSVAALKIGLIKGYSIPDQLSIIGFADGILASRRLSPKLTTVSQHGVLVGEEAAKLLLTRLEAKNKNFPFETKTVKTKLKIRETTRKM